MEEGSWTVRKAGIVGKTGSLCSKTVGHVQECPPKPRCSLLCPKGANSEEYVDAEDRIADIVHDTLAVHQGQALKAQVSYDRRKTFKSVRIPRSVDRASALHRKAFLNLD